MLSHYSIRAVVATLAILISAALSNNALAVFVDGDVITYGQSSWGDDPNPTNAAGLLRANYNTVHASTFGAVEVGIPGASGFSIWFSNSMDLIGYLPASGAPRPLKTDLLNPSTTASGIFGGLVTALRINIGFSDAGLLPGALGIPFGDLQLQNFLHSQFNLNGLTVRQFLGQANKLLGGGSSLFYSIAELAPITAELNASFGGGPGRPVDSGPPSRRVPAGRLPGRRRRGRRRFAAVEGRLRHERRRHAPAR